WRRAEGVIDPFGDTEREVLPTEAYKFILFFAAQAKWPFILLLLIGGLAGIVAAGLYWALGRLIDILDTSTPATLLADHWPALLGLVFLVLFARAAVMLVNTVIEEQVIAPSFYQRVRWQSFRRVMDQP